MKIHFSRRLWNILLAEMCVLLFVFQTSHANGLSDFLQDGVSGIDPQNYDSAISKLTEQIQLNPTNPTPYILRARINLQKGKFDEAITDCDKIIREFHNLTGYAFRGCAYYGKKDYDRAIADLSECIRIKPIRPVYFLRASVYEEKQEYDKAIGDFSEAINLKRNDAYAYLLRGKSYALKGDFDKAIADLDLAILIAPNYSQAYASRGFLWSKKGDYVKGIADCNQSLLWDPKNAGNYNNLAWLLATAPDAKLRDGQRALLNAKRACDLSEWKDPYCLGTLAAAYAETGNFEEAVKWEKKCIEAGLPEKEMKQARRELDLFEQKKPYHAEK